MADTKSPTKVLIGALISIVISITLLVIFVWGIIKASQGVDAQDEWETFRGLIYLNSAGVVLLMRSNAHGFTKLGANK